MIIRLSDDEYINIGSDTVIYKLVYLRGEYLVSIIEDNKDITYFEIGHTDKETALEKFESMMMDISDSDNGIVDWRIYKEEKAAVNDAPL